MANVFKENLWILDTPDPACLLVGASDRLRLKGIRWLVGSGGATAGTSAATLKDASGQTVWSAIATGTNVSDESTICLDLRGGVYLSALSVGTLYLYLE